MKKICDIAFIALFGIMIFIPFIFANRKEAGISEQENRALKSGASLMVDGGLNLNFPQEYEDWFKDNLGFRSKLINWNGSQLYHVFNQFPDSSETKLGRAGDLNYAPDFIIADYQRINVWSDEEADYIAQSYQVINDMVESTGAKFYYVQCVDKHTICPEQFLSGL